MKRRSRPKIAGRGSTLAAAFVQAVIPRNVDPAQQSELFKRLEIAETVCVYCGNEATDQDHLNPIVKGKRPSGYFHTIDNLVPACGPCNQSKSGANWREWMLGGAKNSPATRGVADIEKRVARLTAFEQQARNPGGISVSDMRSAAGAELWDRYWGKLEAIVTALREAQVDADTIQAHLEAAFQPNRTR